jgi:hypothetical protein
LKFRRTPLLWKHRTPGIGRTIESARILELPLNGRNVNDLIVLAGAAVSGKFRDVDEFPKLRKFVNVTEFHGIPMGAERFKRTSAIIARLIRISPARKT